MHSVSVKFFMAGAVGCVGSGMGKSQSRPFDGKGERVHDPDNLMYKGVTQGGGASSEALVSSPTQQWTEEAV